MYEGGGRCKLVFEEQAMVCVNCSNSAASSWKVKTGICWKIPMSDRHTIQKMCARDATPKACWVRVDERDGIGIFS